MSKGLYSISNMYKISNLFHGVILKHISYFFVLFLFAPECFFNFFFLLSLAVVFFFFIFTFSINLHILSRWWCIQVLEQSKFKMAQKMMFHYQQNNLYFRTSLGMFPILILQIAVHNIDSNECKCMILSVVFVFVLPFLHIKMNIKIRF